MAYNQITSNILLGSIMSLKAEKSLREAGATHVLSVLGSEPALSEHDIDRLPIFKTFKHLRLNVDDMSDEDIMQYFGTANKFIGEAISSGGGVLVHCVAGISRSATIVCAYLMAQNKWDPDMALKLVRSKRPVANPNEGFMEQLRVYYLSGFQISPQSKAYREWKLLNRSREYNDNKMAAGEPLYTDVEMPPLTVVWKHIIPALLKRSGSHVDPGVILRVKVDDKEYGVMEPIADAVRSSNPTNIILFGSDESVSEPVKPAVFNDVMKSVVTKLIAFRCKGCSTKLASSGSLVRHQPGPEGVCQHFFVEPVAWMRPELEKGELEGKLMCPECGKKVGAYLWQGSKCTCGVWVTPSIKLSKAKVDEMATMSKHLL